MAGAVLGWVDVGFCWFSKLTAKKSERFFQKGFGDIQAARDVQNTLLDAWSQGGLPWADDRQPLEGLRWIAGPRATGDDSMCTAQEWFQGEPRIVEEEAEFRSPIGHLLPDENCGTGRFLLVRPAAGVKIRLACHCSFTL